MRKEERSSDSDNELLIQKLVKAAKVALAEDNLDALAGFALAIQQIDPECIEAYSLKGKYFEAKKYYVRAIAEYTWIIECLRTERKAVIHYERAKCIEKLGRLPQSIEDNIKSANTYLDSSNLSYIPAQEKLKSILANLEAAFNQDFTSVLVLELEPILKQTIYKISANMRDAYIALMRCQYDLSIKKFTAALLEKENESFKFLIYNYRARAFYYLKDFSNADIHRAGKELCATVHLNLLKFAHS